MRLYSRCRSCPASQLGHADKTSPGGLCLVPLPHQIFSSSAVEATCHTTQEQTADPALKLPCISVTCVAPMRFWQRHGREQHTLVLCCLRAGHVVLLQAWQVAVSRRFHQPAGRRAMLRARQWQSQQGRLQGCRLLPCRRDSLPASLPLSFQRAWPQSRRLRFGRSAACWVCSARGACYRAHRLLSWGHHTRWIIVASLGCKHCCMSLYTSAALSANGTHSSCWNKP